MFVSFNMYMMVACLSCTPDVLPRNKPFQFQSFKHSSFDSREALFLLQKGHTFSQLKQVHARIIRNGLSHNHLVLTKLLRLYSSCKQMDYATLVFHQIQNPLTFTWNLMIRAHTLNHTSLQALLLYNLMITQGVPPDKFTFPFVIKACLVSSVIHKGKEVHGFAIKTGFSRDIFLQNTLMDLYFKCGDWNYGRKIFDKMRVRSIVSWTTMVAGLVSCGELEAARGIFELMPVKNVVSWTAMINGYVRNQQPHEAFELFGRMQIDNVMPNEFTLVSLLVACTELGSLRLGCWIHDFACKNGFELGIFLGTALINMYSKCGSLEGAKEVFDKMQEKSLATWNSMITSLGVHGRGEEALALFAEMEKANLEPDAITFVGVLCACVHTGMVEEGCRYFKDMTERFGIVPTVEHYGCMVELLGRVGTLDEAYRLGDFMPVKPDDETWEVLLRARSPDGNADLEKGDCQHVDELHSTRTITDSTTSSVLQVGSGGDVVVLEKPIV